MTNKKDIKLENLEEGDIGVNTDSGEEIQTGYINGRPYLKKKTKRGSIPSYLAAGVLMEEAGVGGPEINYDSNANVILTSKVCDEPRIVGRHDPNLEVKTDTVYEALGFSRAIGSWDPTPYNILVDNETGHAYRIDLETAGRDVIGPAEQINDKDEIPCFGFTDIEHFLGQARITADPLINDYSDEKLLEISADIAERIDANEVIDRIEETWREEGLYESEMIIANLEGILQNIERNLGLTKN